MFQKVIKALILAAVIAAPLRAVDVNSVTLIGNVYGVGRTIHTGAAHPTDTMTIYGDVGVNIGVYLVETVTCPPALDCFDPWWLSSRCRAVTTTSSFAGGSFSSIACAPHSSADGTDMGACAKITGHLSPDPQTGDNIIYPDTIYPLSPLICDTKP